MIGDVAAGNAVRAVSATAAMLAIPRASLRGQAIASSATVVSDTADRGVCHRPADEPVGGWSSPTAV